MSSIKMIITKGKKKLRKFKKWSKKLVIRLYKIETKVLPVNKQMIVFESNMGRNYTGSPRYIYEEMVRQGLDSKYKCYIMLDDLNTKVPGNAKKIKRTRIRYFFIMGIAGTWVCDSRQPNYIIKRDNVNYIQTWHGTPLKKLALDMDSVNMGGETDIEKYKRNFHMNTQTWDFLLSQNNFSTEIFKRAFAFDKTMLEIGYPRNDILFWGDNEEYISNLKKEMGLPFDKKILLYAPTWRDNQYYSKGAYKFDSEMDFELLRKEIQDEYVIIVKYHYLVRENIDWSKYKGFVYKFDMYDDIAKLYLVSDILITDYSSVMFDYSILKRPMAFFTYDLEEYKDNLRGFYFDFVKEAPGPITLTTRELIDSIKNFKSDDYKEKYDEFHEKFNHADDGTASKKIVELIENLNEK